MSNFTKATLTTWAPSGSCTCYFSPRADGHHAVKFAEKREKLDEPNALRKFLWLGAEKYVADSYARGAVTLREAAEALGIELFGDMGISGNVDADLAHKALLFAGKKAGAKSR